MQGDKIVLDSSVIAALYFTDPYSDWASDIVNVWRHIYTVDIAYVEVTNVAWKRIHLYKQPKREILQGLKEAIKFINNICMVADSRTIIKDALELALNAKITIYDALFVYLAKKHNTYLATLDKKLVNSLRPTIY